MKRFILLCCFCAIKTFAVAQSVNCNFQPPVITLDFGDDRNPHDLSLSHLKDYYKKVAGICPDDGHFSFASYTGGCFFDNWISFNKDHTPGSVRGRMMIVNASYKPATFFALALSGLKPNTRYELSAWFVNVCKRGEGCNPTPPEIRMTVWADGKVISKLYSGAINPTGTDTWIRSSGIFMTPPAFSGISITMDDMTEGGCGNDFAMDDVEVRECKIIEPVKLPVPKPQTVVLRKPEVKEKPVKPIIKKEPPPATVKTKIETQVAPVIKNEKPAGAVTTVKPSVTTVPDVLATRDNPVIKKIETMDSDITVELYDNGEIDGDTVTIYHNNKMLVSHAALSTKPVTVKIKVDNNNPHHELVMVADNLGSIPPNTSLMVITTKYKRHEVFISSSEQKNAKVVIDLQNQ